MSSQRHGTTGVSIASDSVWEARLCSEQNNTPKNKEKPLKDENSLEKGTKENNSGKGKEETERSGKGGMAPGAAGDTSGCRAKWP